ncbi:ATP-dependent Clp protease ATP-binding subunit [Candidatus Falkowbacteria bacterium]|nr:ATP-dependent Clp protease ATP-binding subunit [Candidatus Falkowbacteria bacterium]
MVNIREMGFYLLLLIIGVAVLWKYRKQIFEKIEGTIFTSSVLSLYTTDLTEHAKKGKIDPVIGRDAEIERLTQILSRRTKNNPILIGAAGVGKTAIVEGLALKLVTDDVPPLLRGKRILSLNIADMIGGTKYRGEFEERAKKLVNEIIAERRNIILFIDEIHTLAQAKGTEGAINITDILKPALSRGDLHAIGATTMEDYEKYIKGDDAFARRFQLIEIAEPTLVQTIEILKGLKREYENYHKVRFADEAIEAAVKLSEKYIKDRQLPDKAIDLLDETGAMVNLRSVTLPDGALKLIRAAADEVHRQIKTAPQAIKKLLIELEVLKKKEDAASDDETQNKIKEKIVAITEEIENLEIKHITITRDKQWPIVTERDVKKVAAHWAEKNC